MTIDNTTTIGNHLIKMVTNCEVGPLELARVSSSADASPSTLKTFLHSTSEDSDDEEVTTAEFSVDLADGQTWAINFYECAAEGDLECLEEILDSGHVHVNDVDVDGFTALMVAAAEGHRDVVRALLRRGADVVVPTHELRSTALHFAAKNGDAEIVAALCECDKTAINYGNVNADTPLIWACIEGRVEAVKVLLAHGADVNVLNQYGASTLLCTVMIGEDPAQTDESDARRAEILTLLLEKNPKLVNFQDREGNSAMHLAASCGYLKCVKTLLAFGADITLRNVIGQTPLEEAQDSDVCESGPCVEHLRRIWRQLEEEAAARMMAMLEMEEKAVKGAGGGSNNVATCLSSSKKNKRKSKKAKRKGTAKTQQQPRQVSEQEELNGLNKSLAEQHSSQKNEEKAAEPEDPRNRSLEAKHDDDGSASSEDEEDAHGVGSTANLSTSNMGDAESSDKVKVKITPSAGAWTTVGRKHRSVLAAITLAPPHTSSLKETASIVTATRRKAVATVSKAVPLWSRQDQNKQSLNARERSSSDKETVAPFKQHADVAPTSLSTQEKCSNDFLTASSMPYLSARTTSGFVKTPIALENATTKSTGLFSSSTSAWQASFGAVSAPPHVPLSSLSSISAGRRTWKQQRGKGTRDVGLEARNQWIHKLRLRNESVVETLSSLACGLCGELVNDNLQCSSSGGRDEKTLPPCTQLYCASCLESFVFRTAHSTVIKCVRCHQVITKDSMTRNHLAQTQAASLGLSMSSISRDEDTSFTLEDMQAMLEDAEPRTCAVELKAFHFVPGTDLTTLSNGQLEVLEKAHHLALSQIIEQRLTNARMLERLQMEEWLKMQRNVLHGASR